MRESDFKEDIVRAIRKEGGYARRIEDRFSVGMPDMFLILNDGPAMWIEAKIIEHNLLKPRPRQFIELQRLYRPPHCVTFLIGLKADVVYITPPDTAVHVDQCIKKLPDETIGDLIRRALQEEPNGR